MFPKMRRFKQQLPEEECLELLRNGKRGVLAVNGENGYPFAFPINFYYSEKNGKLYFHGAKAGYKIRCLEKNDKVCFTMHDEGFKREGEWWYCVRSVVCYGRIELVEMSDDIFAQLKGLGEKYFPTPEAMEHGMRNFRGVQMLEMTIDHMTGKFVEEE